MSAIGTKWTSLVAPHMSAFGGKADIADKPCVSYVTPSPPLDRLSIGSAVDCPADEGGNAMSDIALDQTEEILASDVSDEALETAAGTGD